MEPITTERQLRDAMGAPEEALCAIETRHW